MMQLGTSFITSQVCFYNSLIPKYFTFYYFLLFFILFYFYYITFFIFFYFFFLVLTILSKVFFGCALLSVLISGCIRYRFTIQTILAMLSIAIGLYLVSLMKGYYGYVLVWTCSLDLFVHYFIFI